MKERFLRLIRNHTAQAIALAIAYIIIASFISLLKHCSYHTYAFDLGIYAQTLKSTLDGNILYNSPEGMNTLGYHFSPILFLLVPVFWLAPYVETLLVVQSIALGMSGYLVYKLARIQKLSHRTALFAEVLFLISPLVWGVNLFDFHPVAFAVPMLLIMLIGLFQRRWKIFAIGLVLSLMTREDVIMVLAVFGLVMLIAQYVTNKKVDRVYLVTFLSAVVTFGIAVAVAREVSRMSVPPMLMYGSLRYTYINKPFGQAIIGALGTFFSGSSMLLLLAYFLPLGLLPLFSPLWAAPAIFILIISMLATKVEQHCLLQYPAAAIPFLFMALLSTLLWMKGKGRLQLFLQKAWKVLPSAMIAMALLVNLSPISVFQFRHLYYLPDPRNATINRIIALIPNGATVTAPNHIQPHLVLRTDAYLPYWPELAVPNRLTGDFGVPDRDTDYVLLDWQRQSSYRGGIYWEDAIADYLRDRYELVAEEDGVSLYRLK